MVKKSQQKSKTQLTLHGLLGALSYWGTATRVFLFSFLAVTTLLVAWTEASSVTAADNETMVFIYAMSSFLLLDLGYVLAARSYPLHRALDILALVAADIMLCLLYIMPNILVDQRLTVDVDPATFMIFVPIVVLSARMLLGFLFGRRAV